MNNKQPDFESLEYDSADVFRECARIDALESQLDAQSVQQQAAALHQKAVQEAVSQCLGSCLDCLDVLFLRRDPHPFSEVAIAHNSWQQEAEPEPCSRDAWLRGALPEVVLPAKDTAAASSRQSSACTAGARDARGRQGSNSLPRHKGPGSVAADDAGDNSAQHRPHSRLQESRRTSVANSVQSVKAADSPTAAAAAGTSRPGSSTLKTPGGLRDSTPEPTADVPPSIEKVTLDSTLQDAGSSSRAAGTTSTAPTAATAGSAAAVSAPAAATAKPASKARKPALRPSHLTPEQQEAEDRLRQELQLRRKQEAVIKELKQQDEAARSALVNMQNDLKGKDYTYDSKGQVVLLAKVSPDALPAPPGPQFRVQLNPGAGQVNAEGAGGPQPASAAAAAAAGMQQQAPAKSRSTTAPDGSKAAPSKGSGSSSGKGPAAAAGAKAQAQFYIQQASHCQPPLLQSLKPSAGVTLKVGGAAKQGPKKDTSAPQQTRTQFQQQAKALNLQNTKAAASAAGGRLGGPGTASRHGGNTRASSASSAAGGVASTSSSSACRASSANSSSNSSRPAGQSPAAGAAAAAGSVQSILAEAGSCEAASPAAAAAASSPTAAAPAAAAAAPAADCVAGSSCPDINLLLVNAPDWGVAGGASGALVPPAVDVVKPNDRQLQEAFGRTTHLPKTRAPVATLKPPKTQPPSTSRLSQLA